MQLKRSLLFCVVIFLTPRQPQAVPPNPYSQTPNGVILILARHPSLSV